MYPKIILKGAESVITQIDAYTVVKHRPKKGYRVDQLDHKFTTHRTRSEKKILEKLYDAGVAVPKVISCDEDSNTLVLEFIAGKQVKEVLSKGNISLIGVQMGKIIAQIHEQEIIHADLTTSNMLFSNEKIHIVDFGLSYASFKTEDRAVDLHLLHQSLTSYHAPIAKLVMEKVLATYSKIVSNASEVIERYETVEKRGRNKH